MNEIMRRKKVFENYTSSPETTSNFKGTKSPKKNNVVHKNSLISTPKKPGRPKGAKSRINFSPYMKTVEYDEEYAEEGTILESTTSFKPSYASLDKKEIETNLEPPVKQPKVQKKDAKLMDKINQKITLIP